jgi:hypothetical protein
LRFATLRALCPSQRLRPQSPRLRRVIQKQLRLRAERGLANEGELLAVRRPARKTVAVNRRRNVIDRARRCVINADEAMVTALANEGDEFSVWRPSGRRIISARREELMRLAFSATDAIQSALFLENTT